MNSRVDGLMKSLCCCLAIVGGISSVAAAADVEQWGVWETALEGPRDGNPYLTVECSAVIEQGEQRFTVPGFYDGEGAYRIRFSPPTQGSWRFETRSNRPELSGRQGTFEVGPPTPGNHGPVRPYKTFYLRYADGAAYHQFGTTCYAWIHQTRELQEQTLKTLATSPFNKIRFCVFPKSYAYNQNEPELFPFQKKAGGEFDFDRPDPAYWRHLEGRILDLERLGIEADLILWHPYDRWGFADMNDAQDDRYLRYAIARVSAYRNVWWSLANEFDFMTDRPKGHRGNKQMGDWDRFFQILAKEDPHGRMRGIHNGRVWYDHTKGWVTHASVQSSNMEGGVEYRRQFQKPVIYDECRYEGNVAQGWGNLDAKTMTQRFWLGTLGGCYVGHGETYKHPEDILWWSKGGVLHGESPRRIGWLKDLMAEAPPFDELEPLGNDQGRYLLAKNGEYYLLYCVDTRPQTVELGGSRPYKVDLVDPWEMTVLPLGTAQSGESVVRPVGPDVAYRFTPYGDGEPRRPEVKISASATEGIAPLTVRFDAKTDAAPVWQFGDGSRSTETAPTHVYREPGIYRVTLRVADAGGAEAADMIQIAVDRNTTEPIVRAGFVRGEKPELSLKGTAKRGEGGSIVFSETEPWGWGEASDDALEPLCGLRSFTITGWLKPASLKTGSGGNRVVFCLMKDRSGIDLVCHSDGRMRLSVNEWPDRVQNDSSAGTLVVGRWTRFAVTYDAGKASDNVSWYFSEPQELPGGASLVLDCRTTYDAGPVDNRVGPLAIGNFNRTMHSYGLDRQFRGEVRELEIVGSRISGRGALPVEELNRR